MAEILNLVGNSKETKQLSTQAVSAPSVAFSQEGLHKLTLSQVVLMLGTLFIFILWIMNFFLNQDERSFYVNDELSAQELTDISVAVNHGKSFSDRQTRIEKLGWVAVARIRFKQGNNKGFVLIDLERARPIAKLADGSFIFAQNTLIEAQEEVPLLVINSKGKGISPSLEKTLTRISYLLASYNLKISEFKLSQGGGVDVLLVDGSVVKVGSRDHEERLSRLEGFLESYSARINSIKSIDLRHSKGLAVLWSS